MINKKSIFILLALGLDISEALPTTKPLDTQMSEIQEQSELTRDDRRRSSRGPSNGNFVFNDFEDKD